MKVKQLINYDFHDSLLENVSYNAEQKTLQLDIDFCNWKQRGYIDKDPETFMIAMIFDDVKSAEIPNFKFNSDQIVGFNVLNDQKVVIGAYNDVESDCYSITICASEVHIVVL